MRMHFPIHVLTSTPVLLYGYTKGFVFAVVDMIWYGIIDISILEYKQKDLIAKHLAGDVNP